MTTFSYEFVTVPIGRWEESFEDGQRCLRLPLSLVTSMMLEGSITPERLLEAIDACPLWTPLSAQNPSIDVRVMLPNFTVVTFFQRDPKATPAEKARKQLKEYLLGPVNATQGVAGWVAGARRTIRKPPKDTRFDGLQAQQICDNAATYTSSIPRRDFLAYGASAGLIQNLNHDDSKAFDLTTLNTRVMRAANAMVMDSAIKILNGSAAVPSPYTQLATLIGQQMGLEKTVEQVFSGIEPLKKGLGALANRLQGYPVKDARLLSAKGDAVTEEELRDQINGREPNTLLRLASKDPVLAQELGLLIRGWVCISLESSTFTPPTTVCEVGLDLTPPMDPDVSLSMRPTVFRFEERLIFPAPMNPQLGRTGVLAMLNGRDGAQNYQALQVDADGELIKAWVVQGSNTLNTQQEWRETRANVTPGPPNDALHGVTVTNVDAQLKEPAAQQDLRDDKAEELAAQTAGVNRPESKGIAFSASTIDLLTNSDTTYGAAQRERTNKYWLEDLWIGYRIDVARDRNIERPRFISLNLERVAYEPPGMSWKVPLTNSETFFEREQLCLDRPTSAEITTWTGTVEGRTNPLSGRRSHCVPGTGPLDPEVDLTGKLATSRVGEHAALHHTMRGLWRSRNVLCGGISLTPEEADEYLNSLGNANGSAFVQQLNFLRAEPYSPGELINPDVEDPNGEQTLYLLEDGDRKAVVLAPRPLSLSELWFGKYIGVDGDEPDRYRDVALTRNLRRLLIERGRVTERAYFADRAVHQIVVRSQMVNRNPAIAATEHVFQNVECEMVLPHALKALKLKYGERGEWQRYRPVRLEFRAIHEGAPRADGHGRSGQFEIPPGDVLELSILPDVTPEQVADSFFYQNVVNGAAAEGGGAALKKLLSFDALPMFPIIAERRLRVIHATRRPRQTPVIVLDERTMRRETNGGQLAPLLHTLPRHAKDHKAFLIGQVRVDAATTGQLYFEVRWTEINDVVEQPAYVVVEGRFVSPARNVVLSPAPEMLPDKALNIAVSSESPQQNALLLTRNLDHMCVENVVHLLEPKEPPQGRQPAPEQAQTHCNGLDFKSPGRRIATVIAHARTRYREQYEAGNDEHYERVSAPVLIEARNQRIPPEVQVAHVLPTFPNKAGGNVGLRVYLNPPFFLTGVGERCAIGCLFRAEDTVDEYAIAKKYSTLWGEDVFELPRLKETLRVPRATDFVAPAADDGTDLDRTLYPAFSAEEAGVVSYWDNVPLTVVADEVSKTVAVTPELRGLALASFALREDRTHRRYYFDVQIAGGFIGWLKLALYRHQPGSDPGYETSKMPTFVYAAVLNEVPCVQYAEHDWWMVRIGPCFDRTVSYRAGWRRRAGEGVVVANGLTQELEPQIIEGQRFFVLRVSTKEREDLTIYQVRRGAVQTAFRA